VDINLDNHHHKHVNTSDIRDRILTLTKRKNTGSLDNLTDNQIRLYEVIKHLSNADFNKTLTKAEIKNACADSIGFGKRDNVITDFCYNKVNKEDNINKYLISPEAGKFKFVGFNWANNEPEKITWYIQALKKPFKIGSYHGRKFSWNFTELLSYIEEIDNRRLT